MPPQISVVIPVFNGERYVAEALQSVFAQTFRDFEVIVVDDGSTDGSRGVVSALSCQHPVRYVWQPNGERARARNTGVEHSGGQFIAFLDQDDRWLPARLERQWAAFSTCSSQVGVIYTRAYYINESGGRLPYGYHKTLHSGRLTRHLILGNFIRPSSVLVRRECFDRLGGFAEDTVPADDWDLWLRFSSAYEFLLVDEPLAEYRVHPSQTCRNVDALAEAMRHVLARAFSDPRIGPEVASLRRRAYGQVYLELALSYYQVSRAQQARGYLRKAFSADPVQATRRQFWSVFLKSLLGGRARFTRQVPSGPDA